MKTFSNNSFLYIVNQHKLWIESNGKEGFRANLSNCDLSYWSIQINLSKALCINTNFSKCFIKNTDFSGACLRGANFTDCSFENVTVDKHTDLTGIVNGSYLVKVKELTLEGYDFEKEAKEFAKTSGKVDKGSNLLIEFTESFVSTHNNIVSLKDYPIGTLSPVDMSHDSNWIKCYIKVK